MKLQSTLFLFFFWICAVCSQQHPYSVRFSHQIEKEIAEEKISSNRAGLLHSLIGNYHNAISYSDIPVSWGLDSLELSDVQVMNALDIILKAAKDHKMVIISENHLKPQHRIFANKLISKLSKYGYGHLGLETFSSMPGSNDLLDSLLMVRGYPLDSPLTGTYTLEPIMGDLVRKAMKSNYKLFAYERSGRKAKKDRDEIQADNIISYIKDNPFAKIIIVCGFHHAIESNVMKRGKSFWMAKYIKDKTGIDPLTIYQDNFTEKVIEDEHPILKSLKISVPSVFVYEDGLPMNLSDQVDIEVIHPKTNYRNGRPDWIYTSENHKAIKVNRNNLDLDFPIIVSAYLRGEVNSVPIDRIELKHKYDSKALVLEPGNYRITIFDGSNTYEYNEIVDLIQHTSLKSNHDDR